MIPLQSGNAIADVLYGAINPSGHLPYTIPFNESDYNFARIANSTALLETTDPNAWVSIFTKETLIDYRHFDYYDIPVRYPFGHGLSYTNTSLSSLSTTKVAKGKLTVRPRVKITPGGHSELWDTIFKVQVKVTNTGSLSGAAVPQLYVSLPNNGPSKTPKQVLRGFEKVLVQPGETKSVAFNLMRRDLSEWDIVGQAWVLLSGEIYLRIGFSSRDLILKGSIETGI